MTNPAYSRLKFVGLEELDKAVSPEREPTPEAITDNRRLLGKVAEQIPPEIFRMFAARADGASWKEIADTFDIPSPEAARKKLARATSELRILFPDEVTSLHASKAKAKRRSNPWSFVTDPESIDWIVEFFPDIPSATATHHDGTKFSLFGGNCVNKLIKKLAREGFGGQRYRCINVSNPGQGFRTGLIEEQMGKDKNNTVASASGFTLEFVKDKAHTIRCWFSPEIENAPKWPIGQLVFTDQLSDEGIVLCLNILLTRYMSLLVGNWDEKLDPFYGVHGPIDGATMHFPYHEMF